MKQYKYPDAKQIIVSGDIHGDFKTLVFKLCIQYGCTDTLLIVAGDCGFGFDKPGYYDQVYNSVADRLRKANNWIVFVRGNHDNPAYYAEERINHARWRTVPDYSIISVCEHNILCIGGATSIDRYQRIKENARNHVKDVASERTVMDQIFQSIKSQGHPLQKWFYGHFHQSWNGFVDKTHFSMLDIMEFKEV